MLRGYAIRGKTEEVKFSPQKCFTLLVTPSPTQAPVGEWVMEMLHLFH